MDLSLQRTHLIFVIRILLIVLSFQAIQFLSHHVILQFMCIQVA